MIRATRMTIEYSYLEEESQEKLASIFDLLFDEIINKSEAQKETGSLKAFSL